MNFNDTRISSSGENPPTQRVFGEISLFDLHCDTLYEGAESHNCGEDFSLYENGCHVDLKRGLEHKKWVQIFASWIPDSVRGNSAFRLCSDSLSIAHDTQKNNFNKFEIVKKFSEIPRILSEEKCAAILAIESGAALGGKLENLDFFAKLGVKLITLTWSGENELGYGCDFDKMSIEVDKAFNKADLGGLKPFGKQAVHRMEELSIIPDVSHLSEMGFWDVMEITEKAVVATHSVSHFINPHIRNLRDEQFNAIKKRGGIVGLNLCASHLGERTSFNGGGKLGKSGKGDGGTDLEKWSGEKLVDGVYRHLEHYLSLGGVDTVALGCDLDGTELPYDWTGIQNLCEIYNFLLRKNYQEKLVSKLFFDNSYDFFLNRA